MKNDALLIKYLNRPIKELIKSIAYPCLRSLLRHSNSYKNWHHKKIFRQFVAVSSFTNKISKLLLLSYYQRTETDLCIKIKDEPHLKLAIIIHAFYLDVFLEIMNELKSVDREDIKLYISARPESRNEVESVLQNFSLPYTIKECENKGRDILPFLLMLPEVLADGRNLVLKLHTKGSNHLNRKSLWKNDLYNKLIGRSQIHFCVDLFRKYSRLGMLAPEGHVLPMSYYYGSNALQVKKLLDINGLASSNAINLDFIAGSMFYARIAVLQPLLTLNLKPEDFELENGQLDGTMAHAVERIFTGFLPQLGYYLGDTNPKSYPDIKYKVTVNHRFTV